MLYLCAFREHERILDVDAQVNDSSVKQTVLRQMQMQRFNGAG
jgi:hypothetical protein